jgi:phosphatidylserine decarboxylase
MTGRTLPIASEGWGFILAPLALALALFPVGGVALAGPCVLLAAFMAFFFRDPERTPPSLGGAILAPADGKVVDARAAVDDAFVGPAQAVSIFLSPLDVHVNRAPLAGLVVEVEHRPGAKTAAFRVAASERNERTSIAIQGEAGRVVVRQIAGVLARRIVCRVRPGDKLAAGQRFGMIRFGSRADVIMPAAVQLRVRVGDRVRAGESVLGVLP